MSISGRSVTASARRRKWFYDGKDTLAVYVASISDTDDIVPILVALPDRMEQDVLPAQRRPDHYATAGDAHDHKSPVFTEITKVLRERLHIHPGDWRRLEVIWGERLWENLRIIGQGRKSFSLRMLGGSHVGFVRATRKWWAPVEKLFDTLGLQNRPVYFVSSNTHSLVNLTSGFALKHQDALTRFCSERARPVSGGGVSQAPAGRSTGQLAELPLLRGPRV